MLKAILFEGIGGPNKKDPTRRLEHQARKQCGISFTQACRLGRNTYEKTFLLEELTMSKPVCKAAPILVVRLL